MKNLLLAVCGDFVNHTDSAKYNLQAAAWAHPRWRSVRTGRAFIDELLRMNSTPMRPEHSRKSGPKPRSMDNPATAACVQHQFAKFQ